MAGTSFRVFLFFGFENDSFIGIVIILFPSVMVREDVFLGSEEDVWAGFFKDFLLFGGSYCFLQGGRAMVFFA